MTTENPSFQPAPEPLHLGACLTDGKLHATVMRREPNGHITVVATAEIAESMLRKHDCHAVMTPAVPAPAVAPRLSADDVQWIVNDLAELGVMIHGQAFFLYKGHSLVYEDATHDDGGGPMHYRPVFKREFGECAHPINYANLTLIGTVSLDDSDEWRALPPAKSDVPVQGQS